MTLLRHDDLPTKADEHGLPRAFRTDFATILCLLIATVLCLLMLAIPTYLAWLGWGR